MYRIDEATAASSLPTPAALGTQGYFTNGNPGTGVAATIVDADWLNMIQEELMSVIIAGGETASKTTRNQVLTAINTLISGGGSGSLLKANNLSDLPALATALTNLTFGSNSSSYFKVPNPNNTARPWIVQFGNISPSSTSDTLVTLPVTFPNAFLGTSLGIRYTVGTTPAIVAAWSPNSGSPLTSFYMRNNSGSGNAVDWIVIGN